VKSDFYTSLVPLRAWIEARAAVKTVDRSASSSGEMSGGANP
jgi:hypothetical protein